MKPLYSLILVIALTGCAGASNVLDHQAAVSNLDAVEKIVEVNENYLKADTVRDPALIATDRDLDSQAVIIAKKLAGR